MSNEEFRAYIDQKLAQIRRTIVDPEASPEEAQRARAAQPLYESAQKMARHSSGPAFRRFRRDWERRMAKRS